MSWRNSTGSVQERASRSLIDTMMSAMGGRTPKYKRDRSRPECHGWHAFGRGLGTNLAELGVDELTIQPILRHANVATTRAPYIKVRNPKVEAAMQLLDGALCANRALDATDEQADV